jgi:voltage-gated potassium channel
VYPVTDTGKILSGVVVIVGIMIFALPTAIFAAGFVEEIEQEQEVYCPHCGRKIDKDTSQQSTGPPKEQDKIQK